MLWAQRLGAHIDVAHDQSGQTIGGANPVRKFGSLAPPKTYRQEPIPNGYAFRKFNNSCFPTEVMIDSGWN
jgi:hypothetical protein